MRTVTLNDLKHEYCFSHIIECHRQSWRKNIWRGYESSPRFADGILIICSDIKATILSDQKEALVAGRGNCVYIPKGTCYTVNFENGGNETDLYTVNFLLKDKNGEELRLGKGIGLFTENISAECITIASRLAESSIAFDKNLLKMQSELLSLINAITESRERDLPSYRLIRMGIILLDKEWNLNFEIKRYAIASGMSETNFYLRFKEWAGVSPTVYRNGIRVSVAKSLLANSNFSVSEIAAHIGFEDQYYFSRLFKKVTGHSPREYRNQASTDF